MTNPELKQILISHLRTIDDEVILNKIKEIIFEDKSRKLVYLLSDYEKEQVKQGISDLNNGKVADADVFFKDVDEWLKKDE